MDILLATFISVHSQKIKLFFSDGEVN